MICVTRQRGGVRRLEIYHPRPEQISLFMRALRPLDVILVRGSQTRLASYPAIVSERTTQTTTIDLSLSESELMRRMSYGDWRQKLRKAARLGERLEVRTNDTATCADFLDMYNRFVDRKGFGVRPLNWTRMAKFEGLYDVFAGYIDGKPLAAQLALRDEDERRIIMAFAVSVRLEGDADPALVGCVNRYLFWHVMRHYKGLGFLVYDFAGINREKVPTITRFKLSLGGEVVTLHDYVIAGWVARRVIKLREASRRLLDRSGFEQRVWSI